MKDALQLLHNKQKIEKSISEIVLNNWFEEHKIYFWKTWML